MDQVDQLGHDRSSLLDAIVRAFPEPFFVLDRQGTYLAVLGGGDTQRYHDGTALVGKRLHEVMPGPVADEYLGVIERALDSGSVVHHRYELGADQVEGLSDRPGLATRLVFEGHVAPVPRTESGEGPEMVVWLAFNITKLQRALDELESQQSELERLARTDPLTGLPNRRAFFEAVEVELVRMRRTGAPASIVLFDLDEFKQVNDRWGHAAGDAVLVELAQVFMSFARASDATARLGGEEFALLLHKTDLDQAAAAADRLREQIAAMRVRCDGSTVDVTASCGVTALHADDAEVSEALKRADRALYRAKSAGRNRTHVDGGG